MSGNRVFFVRVRDGVVIEKGVTDEPGFAAMEQQSDECYPLATSEYFSVTDSYGLVKDADITVIEFKR